MVTISSVKMRREFCTWTLLYTVQYIILHNVHSAVLCTVHCTIHHIVHSTVHSTVNYNVISTVHSNVHFTVHSTVNSTVIHCTIHHIIHSTYAILYTLLYTLIDSILEYSPLSTLRGMESLSGSVLIFTQFYWTLALNDCLLQWVLITMSSPFRTPTMTLSTARLPDYDLRPSHRYSD